LESLVNLNGARGFCGRHAIDQYSVATFCEPLAFPMHLIVSRSGYHRISCFWQYVDASIAY